MGPTELEWATRRQSGWSISRLGMVTERAFLFSSMPNSPRKESVPMAVLRMSMRPLMKPRARSVKTPLDSRLPVVSWPMWLV